MSPWPGFLLAASGSYRWPAPTRLRCCFPFGLSILSFRVSQCSRSFWGERMFDCQNESAFAQAKSARMSCSERSSRSRMSRNTLAHFSRFGFLRVGCSWVISFHIHLASSKSVSSERSVGEEGLGLGFGSGLRLRLFRKVWTFPETSGTVPASSEIGAASASRFAKVQPFALMVFFTKSSA